MPRTSRDVAKTGGPGKPGHDHDLSLPIDACFALNTGRRTVHARYLVVQTFPVAIACRRWLSHASCGPAVLVWRSYWGPQRSYLGR